jgi:hypothetical protein
MNGRYTADITFPAVVISDIDSALGALHPPVEGSIADVSEVHAASRSTIEMNRVAIHPSVL